MLTRGHKISEDGHLRREKTYRKRATPAEGIDASKRRVGCFRPIEVPALLSAVLEKMYWGSGGEQSAVTVGLVEVAEIAIPRLRRIGFVGDKKITRERV